MTRSDFPKRIWLNRADLSIEYSCGPNRCEYVRADILDEQLEINFGLEELVEELRLNEKRR